MSLRFDSRGARPIAGPAGLMPRLSSLLSMVRHQRRPWPLVVVVAAFLVAVWLGFGALQVARAAGEDRAGLRAVEVGRQGLAGPGLLSGDGARSSHGDEALVLAQLSLADRSFGMAAARLDNPLLSPFELLPVLGRQLRSAQALSRAAQTASRAGVVTVTRAQAVLTAPHSTGAQRVRALRELGAVAISAADRLAGLDLGPQEALVGPLARARAQLAAELTRSETELRRAGTGTMAAADVLGGHHRYLVLAANNGEMRAGSGAFLEAGVLTSNDGNLTLAPMVATGNLALPVGRVSVGGDLSARWGWLHPGAEWRNLNVTPQFDVVGPLAVRMWTAATGQTVDGVIALDPEVLARVMSVTGPVSVGGVQIGPNEVVQYLVHDQYVGLSDSQAQRGRRDRLGVLARAVLGGLENERAGLTVLASGLARAGAGRHIMLWSADRSDEAAWRELGVAGQLSPEDLLVSVLNTGGNKLDDYLGVNVSLGRRPHDAANDFTLRVRLDNRTPPGQSQYIAGPFPGTGAGAGEYLGLLAVNLPAGVEQAHVVGQPSLVVAGPEGPTLVLAVPFSLAPGHQRDLVVRWRLPGRHGGLTVLPSARIPAEAWSGPGGPFTDAAPHYMWW